MGTVFVDNLEPQSGTTLTLGASGDTIALASGASLSGIASTNGITMADQWRLSADFSLPTGRSDITSNIERADTRGAGQIGSAMSVASGVFTFPSTGYYLVMANISFYTPANNGNLTFETKPRHTDSVLKNSIQRMNHESSISKDLHQSSSHRCLGNFHSKLWRNA